MSLIIINACPGLNMTTDNKDRKQDLVIDKLMIINTEISELLEILHNESFIHKQTIILCSHTQELIKALQVNRYKV